jgi:tRNA G18 (ribose-2'-O)-methylase SpoU
MEALESGAAIEKIFMLRSASGPEINTIKNLARNLNIPVSQVPVEKLDHLTKSQHQGVVAWASLLHYIDLQAGISHIVEQGQTPLFVLLDGITDVRNVGAIARSALCCGAQALILPTSHAASLTEEAVKASAGALHKILLCRIPSVPQAIDVLKLNGIQILGTQMKGSVPVYYSLDIKKQLFDKTACGTKQIVRTGVNYKDVRDCVQLDETIKSYKEEILIREKKKLELGQLWTAPSETKLAKFKAEVVNLENDFINKGCKARLESEM